MQFNYFIGVDVSKQTLDYCIIKDHQVLLEIKLSNTKQGIRLFLKELKSLGADLKESLFCMEHTGIYNNPLLYYCSEKGLNLWLESAFQIKYSMGRQRQKDDKADAKIIARYAYKNKEEVKLWQAPRSVVTRLKALIASRQRLLRLSKSINQPLKEEPAFIHREQAKEIKRGFANTLNALKKDLAYINKQIQNIINSDEELKRLFTVITSVDGVGPITAYAIIATTNEFKSITKAKKMACYSGVVPFSRTSGTSVNGRPRVSHLANKDMKTLLHLAACSAIKMKGEMRDYFERKQYQGKSKMLIINNIRNKIIHRIYACVLNNRLYEKNYTTVLYNP